MPGCTHPSDITVVTVGGGKGWVSLLGYPALIKAHLDFFLGYDEHHTRVPEMLKWLPNRVGPLATLAFVNVIYQISYSENEYIVIFHTINL